MIIFIINFLVGILFGLIGIGALFVAAHITSTLVGLGAKIRYTDKSIAALADETEFYSKPNFDTRWDRLQKERDEKGWSREKFYRRWAVVCQYMPKGGY
jgi:hypothetical protein